MQTAFENIWNIFETIADHILVNVFILEIIP